MGVQLFGRMEFHCVLPGTDPNNVTIAGKLKRKYLKEKRNKNCFEN